MTRQDVVLIYLSLQLLITSMLYAKALQRAAYDEGVLSVYHSFQSDGTEGTCLVPKSQGGCKP